MKDATIDTVRSEGAVVIEQGLKFITTKDLMIREDPTKNKESGHCYPSNVNARTLMSYLHF